ncbi:hypothetical protein HMPREF0682_1677 [Propionibacterium acidifaciens F0233]|uniref:Uncharacterized protein n=1 Tax=Propionibacterium acidifaciens F0233 TaxID=553198 RepID=U2QHJ1_9ACTN|nr:hypothetical protein HMPREF0682_1677 [Propionibacterium acidifaciens F0233]
MFTAFADDAAPRGDDHDPAPVDRPHRSESRPMGGLAGDSARRLSDSE